MLNLLVLMVIEGVAVVHVGCILTIHGAMRDVVCSIVGRYDLGSLTLLVLGLSLTLTLWVDWALMLLLLVLLVLMLLSLALCVLVGKTLNVVLQLLLLLVLMLLLLWVGSVAVERVVHLPIVAIVAIGGRGWLGAAHRALVHHEGWQRPTMRRIRLVEPRVGRWQSLG